jgi:carboxymethylenebutenolidase
MRTLYFLVSYLAAVGAFTSLRLSCRYAGRTISKRSLNMLTVESETVTLQTPTGPMKTVVLRPNSRGKYPGIIFYSEIFQLTGPIMRTAQAIAGHGFVVALPEIYHASSSGWVGEYTTEGADIGNKLKVETPAQSHDGDSATVIKFLKENEHCTGELGTAGFCIGGHLCLRAAMMNDCIRAVASWYPTDMHTGDGVCAGLADRSLVSSSRRPCSAVLCSSA